MTAYKQKHNADPSGAVMESYDGAWLLFDAIKRAKSTESKAIIHELETTSYVGVRGKYSFSTSHEPAWHYHQFLDAPLTSCISVALGPFRVGHHQGGLAVVQRVGQLLGRPPGVQAGYRFRSPRARSPVGR